MWKSVVDKRGMVLLAGRLHTSHWTIQNTVGHSVCVPSLCVCVCVYYELLRPNECRWIFQRFSVCLHRRGLSDWDERPHGKTHYEVPWRFCHWRLFGLNVFNRRKMNMSEIYRTLNNNSNIDSNVNIVDDCVVFVRHLNLALEIEYCFQKLLLNYSFCWNTTLSFFFSRNKNTSLDTIERNSTVETRGEKKHNMHKLNNPHTPQRCRRQSEQMVSQSKQLI